MTRLIAALLVAFLLAPAGQAQTTFTVTVGPKTQAHPYSGQGWDESYRIDGVDGAEVTLERGETYIFQMSNVPEDHPFYISTSATGGGINQWNDGVTGNFATGNSTVTFAVPNEAPDVLWYQCGSHSHMGWRINITGEGVATEGQASNEILAVSGPFPNPGADTATLLLDLAAPAEVRVVVSDALGRRVSLTSVGHVEAGPGQPVVIDVSGLAVGTYVYRLEARVGGETHSAGGRFTRAH